MKNIFLVFLTLFYIHGHSQDRPNILWLVSEDNNVNWIGCYGNKFANTPNIDRLAEEGFQYMNTFSNAPVCAVSRTTLITGIHATTMGTQGMRSRYDIPHDIISYYPDIMKKGGYFCANFKKTDYNIGGRKDSEAWDTSEPVNWELLKENQPFIQVINTGKSHESQIKRNVKLIHSVDEVNLAPYHPDIKEMREDYARYHDCVTDMDGFIGKQLEALEASGMAESTIVIYCSDHGGVLPRSKRYIFDSGTHSPLIIRIPEKFKDLWPADKTGSQIDRLVSFIDFPKTWINLTGTEAPETMKQGKVFLGKNSETEREYHFSYRGRMDERTENQRAVRTKEYLYVKNYLPQVPWGQRLSYMWGIKSMHAWHDLYLEGKTDDITGRFFTPKNANEFYVVGDDPYNTNNLIDDPKYKNIIAELDAALTKWQIETNDLGLLPESEIYRRIKENNITGYEMGTNRKLYDLEGYLKISDIALKRDVNNKETLLKAISNADSGYRYWGIMGLSFIKNDLSKDDFSAIKKLLKDDSDNVVGVAACMLVESNMYKKEALDVLRTLITTKSYAIIDVLNMVDYIGPDVKVLYPEIDALRIATKEDPKAFKKLGWHMNFKQQIRKICEDILVRY
jgi:arylsulfatase A-like enzyme